MRLLLFGCVVLGERKMRIRDGGVDIVWSLRGILGDELGGL